MENRRNWHRTKLPQLGEVWLGCEATPKGFSITGRHGTDEPLQGEIKMRPLSPNDTIDDPPAGETGQQSFVAGGRVEAFVFTVDEDHQIRAYRFGWICDGHVQWKPKGRK